MGQEVRALDPGVQISTYGTLEGSLQEFYRGSRFQLATLSAFAGIGLVLVVIGIFSVMAYAVSLRTNEIGVRWPSERNSQIFCASCSSTVSVWSRTGF